MAHIEYKQDGYNFVIFTSSEKWAVPKGVKKVDVSVISGGSGGNQGSFNHYYGSNYVEYYIVNGGKGGSGGNLVTKYDVIINDFVNIVIGAGGNYGTSNKSNSSIFGDIIAKGKSDGASGSNGAKIDLMPSKNPIYKTISNASGGNNGMVCPLNNVKYCGGGGGGQAVYSFRGYAYKLASAAKGTDGGGNGNGFINGEVNTGGGGGGNCSTLSNYSDMDYGTGGTGGSGVIILRYKIESNNIFFANNF